MTLLAKEYHARFHKEGLFLPTSLNIFFLLRIKNLEYIVVNDYFDVILIEDNKHSVGWLG